MQINCWFEAMCLLENQKIKSHFKNGSDANQKSEKNSSVYMKRNEGFKVQFAFSEGYLIEYVVRKFKADEEALLYAWIDILDYFLEAENLPWGNDSKVAHCIAGITQTYARIPPLLVFLK